MREVFDELWFAFKFDPDFRILCIALFVFFGIIVFWAYTMSDFM